MSTVRQAAVLLANLPADDAAVLLAKLDPTGQHAVRAEMTRVSADNNEFQSAVICFAHDNRTVTLLAQRSLSELLQQTDNQTLLATVIDEHPQTIALIVANLPRRRAVQTLADLPKELQATLVKRIASTERVDPEILREVVDGLQHRLNRITRERIENRAA